MVCGSRLFGLREIGSARADRARRSRRHAGDKFGQILVPVEEVVEMRGQKTVSEREFFPAMCSSRWK